jgi:hypothetical protein
MLKMGNHIIRGNSLSSEIKSIMMSNESKAGKILLINGKYSKAEYVCIVHKVTNRTLFPKKMAIR